MRRITIILAETHRLLAQGLQLLLEARPGVEVLHTATDGFDALEACRRHNPNLLIIDTMIPGLDAVEVIRQLDRYSSPTRVLLTLPCIQQERLASAIQAGAVGAVIKSDGVDELYQAVDAALRGELRLPPEANGLRGAYVRGDAGSATPYSRLTARERTIFKLLAEGLSVKQVALQLELKPKTVDVHKTNLMRKLDVHDRGELIHFAFREGLVNVQPSGAA